MTRTTEQDEQIYHVVVNDEEQYSIWPVDQDLPDGWRAEGRTGPKSECLAHIDEVWTDMRPLSLRRYMAEHADDAPVEPDPVDDDRPTLVDRLCSGSHPLRLSLEPEAGPAALREALDQGYVFVRFVGTEGGTELGVRVDPDRTDLTGGDLAAGTGQVRIVGTLNLDFEPVRCLTRIDLATLDGEGHLERLGES